MTEVKIFFFVKTIVDLQCCINSEVNFNTVSSYMKINLLTALKLYVGFSHNLK